MSSHQGQKDSVDARVFKKLKPIYLFIYLFIEFYETR